MTSGARGAHPSGTTDLTSTIVDNLCHFLSHVLSCPDFSFMSINLNYVHAVYVKIFELLYYENLLYMYYKYKITYIKQYSVCQLIFLMSVCYVCELCSFICIYKVQGNESVGRSHYDSSS